MLVTHFLLRVLCLALREKDYQPSRIRRRIEDCPTCDGGRPAHRPSMFRGVSCSAPGGRFCLRGRGTVADQNA